MNRNRLKRLPGALAKCRFLQWALGGARAVLLGGGRPIANLLFTTHSFGVMAETYTMRMHYVHPASNRNAWRSSSGSGMNSGSPSTMA